MSTAIFYLHDPAAPKPNQPTHLGANILLCHEDRLLLEKRRDCGVWGLPGGGIKRGETEAKGIIREVWEETGIRITEAQLQKLKVFQDRDRIASFPDGSVWRMVVYLYRVELKEEPKLRCSAESKDIRFFAREELKDLPIICTHQDMVELF